MGLLARLNLVMAAVAVVLLAGFGYWSKQVIADQVQNDATERAAIIMDAASAIRDYTAREIVPLLSEQMKVQFLPHSVPSWAAQTQLRVLGKDYAGVSYKEAADNPTNIDDRAEDWEEAIIKMFRDKTSETQDVRLRLAKGQTQLALSRPVRLTDRACLTCHSTPAEAPAQMIDLYRDKNGFNWKLGDVVAVRLVTLPLDQALYRGNLIWLTLMSALAVLAAALMLAANVIVRQGGTKPLADLVSQLNAAAVGTSDVQEFRAAGSRDVSRVADAISRLKAALTPR